MYINQVRPQRGRVDKAVQYRGISTRAVRSFANLTLPCLYAFWVTLSTIMGSLRDFSIKGVQQVIIVKVAVATLWVISTLQKNMIIWACFTRKPCFNPTSKCHV